MLTCAYLAYTHYLRLSRAGKVAVTVTGLLLALAVLALVRTSYTPTSALLTLPAGNAVLMMHTATYTGAIVGNDYRAVEIGHGPNGFTVNADGVLDN